jgi:hypothetical protein
MKEIMTITLSDKKPSKDDGDAYAAGDQATIFLDESNGEFGYCYHGVRSDGSNYRSRYFAGFDDKQAALRDAVQNYVTIGLGC